MCICVQHMLALYRCRVLGIRLLRSFMSLERRIIAPCKLLSMLANPVWKGTVL